MESIKKQTIEKKATKVYANLYKTIYGRGPENIYSKLEEDILSIYMRIGLINLQSFIIKNFKDEGIKIVEDLDNKIFSYLSDNLTFKLSSEINEKLEFISFNTDFINKKSIHKYKILKEI